MPTGDGFVSFSFESPLKMRYCDTVPYRCLDEPDLAVAINHFADDVMRLTREVELVFDELQKLWADDDDHSDAQVERAQHIFARHIADLPHQVEDGRHGPTGFLDRHVNVRRQNTRDVFDQAATGDV